METSIQLQEHAAALNFFSRYNERKIEKMLELFSPSAVAAFIPLGDDGAGKVEGIGRYLWTGLIDSFPDISNTIKKSRIDQHGSLICEVNIGGTQVKDFAGIPNKGLRFNSDHIFIFRFNEQGLIESISVNWDHQDLCRQLGGEA
ncbi:nuclear transport factor 2 family protein [Cesiribacter sp. SM1]|uniref:nuclear transport factor 2 family protein n=1 Tax=Cesiribacter sp. SM1 TaxID=2861196 RepID=UPI001CD5A400|nr:nuclear transport factor 2 family protein [Cesiribacter sp. SM1]